MRIKDYTDTIRHLTDPFNIPEARRMIAENPALTQEQFKAGGIVEPGVTHYATSPKKTEKFKYKTTNQWGTVYSDKKPKILPRQVSSINLGEVADLVQKANEGNKWVNMQNIADQYYKNKKNVPKRIQLSGTTARPILDTLETKGDKINKVLADMLTSDKPIPTEGLEKGRAGWRSYIMKETGIGGYREFNNYFKDTDFYKTHEKALLRLGKSGLSKTQLANLPFDKQLEYSYHSLEGRTRFTGLGSNMRLLKSSEYVTMEIAKNNWIRNLGDGAIRFYDAKGDLIDFKPGTKLPFGQVSFSVGKSKKRFSTTGLKGTIDIRQKANIEKYFPEVNIQNKLRNRAMGRMVDDPFKKGSKIEFGNLMRKINAKAYGWKPEKSVLEILHGPLGVKGEPFTNLSFGTARLNTALYHIDVAEQAGNITKGLKNKLVKQAFSGLKGKEDEKLIQAIIKQQTQVAKERIAGKKFYTPRTDVVVDLFKNTPVSKRKKLFSDLMKGEVYSIRKGEDLTKILAKETKITPSALQELMQRQGAGFDPLLAGRAAVEEAGSLLKKPMAKTLSALKWILETKTPAGGAFWAAEAPILMLQGAYGRYANERDFKAGLTRMGMPDEFTEQLGEVYGQELADLGQVGLESWAVDQPDTFETRKMITEQMAEKKPHFETRQAGPLMMKDFGAIKTDEREIQGYEEQLKQYEIEKRTREAYEREIGRREGGIMGLKK